MENYHSNQYRSQMSSTDPYSIKNASQDAKKNEIIPVINNRAQSTLSKIEPMMSDSPSKESLDQKKKKIYLISTTNKYGKQRYKIKQKTNNLISLNQMQAKTERNLTPIGQGIPYKNMDTRYQNETYNSNDLTEVTENGYKYRNNSYGIIRYKKNNLSKSLNKIKEQNNLKTSDTQQLLAVGVYDPINLKVAIQQKLIEKKGQTKPRKYVNRSVITNQHTNSQHVSLNQSQSNFQYKKIEKVDNKIAESERLKMSLNPIHTNETTPVNSTHEETQSQNKSRVVLSNMQNNSTKSQMSKNKSENLKTLSLSKILQNKKQTDREALQLHTRIQYLQNQEQKRLRKIAESRQQASQIFQNQLGNRRLQLEVEQTREQEERQRQMSLQRAKENQQKVDLATQILQRKCAEAKAMRKEKKKNNKIKFKMEVEHVKNNIEKRDEIWYQQKVRKMNKQEGQRSKFDKNKFEMEEKSMQLQQIKLKSKKINKLTSIEKELLGRLKSTTDLEQNILLDLSQEKLMQAEILRNFKLHDIENLQKSKSFETLDNYKIHEIAQKPIENRQKLIQQKSLLEQKGVKFKANINSGKLPNLNAKARNQASKSVYTSIEKKHHGGQRRTSEQRNRNSRFPKSKLLKSPEEASEEKYSEAFYSKAPSDSKPNEGIKIEQN